MNNFANMCQYASLAQVEYMYETGQLSQIQYEAYCWLWRNSVTRLSSECWQYESTDFTHLFKELMFELHGLIL